MIPDGATHKDCKDDFYKFDGEYWYFYSKQVKRYQFIEDVSLFFELFDIKPLYWWFFNAKLKLIY